MLSAFIPNIYYCLLDYRKTWLFWLGWTQCIELTLHILRSNHAHTCPWDTKRDGVALRIPLVVCSLVANTPNAPSPHNYFMGDLLKDSNTWRGANKVTSNNQGQDPVSGWTGINRMGLWLCQSPSTWGCPMVQWTPRDPKQCFMVKTRTWFQGASEAFRHCSWEIEWMSWAAAWSIPSPSSVLHGALGLGEYCFAPGKHTHPSAAGVGALRPHGPHVFMNDPTLELFGVLQTLMWQSWQAGQGLSADICQRQGSRAHAPV